MKKTKQFRPTAFILNTKMKVSLMLLLMLMLVPQGAWALGGSGTSSDPFTIANENDLFEFANRVNNNSYGDNCFKLVANITLTKAWTPIGTSSKPYTGTFDGNNKTISGLNLTAKAANAGLFGYVNGATIKNFSLAGSISSNSDNVGSVVGSADGATKIYNVYSSVGITMTAAKSHIGGIVGQLLQETGKVPEVKGCAYSGTMNLGSSTDSNGGIVGYCEKEANVQIEYCFFSGSISSSGSTPRIGGILGYADDENSQNFNYIRNCYCDGTLSPSSGTYVGVIAGYPRGNVPGVITNNTYKSGMATNALGNSKTSSTSTPITISVTAGANGTVSHSYVNPTSTTATQLQVVATPSAHYHFGSWSDSGAQTHSVGLTANVSLSASFAIDQHTISVATNNANYGTVSGGGTFDYNSTKTIKATAKAHYHFVEWNDGNTDATRTITVTGDKTYTATFAIDQHTITVNVANGQTDMGTVSGGGTFDYNSTKTITATPKEHYHFVKWNDGNTNASRTITVTENKTYTASFAPNQYTITVKVEYYYRGTVNTTGGTYDYGTELTITATPNTGYHFIRWKDGDKHASRTITVNGDATYIADFDPHTYGEWSTDTPATCTETGTKHRECTVEGCNGREDVTIPATGHSFGEWITDTDPACTADGTKHRECTVEGCNGREDGTIPATGHSFGEWTTDVAATCTADGTKHRVCTVDGCNGREDGTIRATGHSFSEWITDTPATCIAEGTKHRECTHAGCDERENGTIEMVDHTCSDFDANGFGECSVCHAEQYERPERDGDIWQIRNAGQLYYYADIVNKYNHYLDRVAELRNDIVVNDGTFDADGNFTPTGSSTTSTPRSWTPIGDVDNNRVVYIEGYGHTISGLYFNNENTDAVGFVGEASGTIKNLGVTNCYFKGHGAVGGICGSNSGYDIKISDCYATGRICGVNTTGGLMGMANKGTSISRCWSDCIVTGTGNYVGGFCGGCFGVVEDCYSNGTVNGTANYVGGFCGRIYSTSTRFGTIRNCYTTTTVSGASIVGSICGETMENALITNCYSTNTTLPAIAENNGTAHYCESNVTAERLASGEIAYKLNSSVDGEGNWTAGPTNGTQTWFQKLGEDATPVLTAADGNTVYTYTDCQSLAIYTNYDYYMDGHQWGDDHTCTVCHHVADVAHTGTSGTCTWTIYEDGHMIIEPTEGETGTLGEWMNWDGMPWYAYRSEIKSVKFQGEVIANTCYCMFFDCPNLTTVDFCGFNTANVWDMSEMFNRCSSLQSLDLSGFNTANVRDMSHMFSDCSDLQSLDLSSFNTANVEGMEGMFSDCLSLATLKLSNDFVLKEGVNKGGLFRHCGEYSDWLSIYYVIDQNIQEALSYRTNLEHPGIAFVPSAIIKDGVPFKMTYEEGNYAPAKDVVFTRTFSPNKPATITLPFEVDANVVTNAKFYGFTSLDYNNATGKWEANMDRVKDDFIQAYTPYMVLPEAESIDFDNGIASFMPTPSELYNTTQGDWTFVALNETKTWEEGDPELGRALLVTEESNTNADDNGSLNIELVKIEAGTTLKAGRCYFLMNEMPTIKGDVNNDGRVSIADLTLLIEILNGRATDTTGNADVDGKNGVTIDDVEALRNIILGTQSSNAPDAGGESPE